MLIVMKPDASAEQIAQVLNKIEEFGLTGTPVPGKNQTAVAVTGNITAVDPAKFENISGVEKAVRITKPHHLAQKSRDKQKTIVKIGDAFIGDGSLAIIAGPCAVESKEQVFQAAEAVKKSGAKFFRGGAFKPRTSPYAFQGLGEDGLKILAEVRNSFGLNIVTEAMDEYGIDLVSEYGDCIQIGARNMQNFSLLKYAGKAKKPVLLKRGLSATLDELLLAAEYILSAGNENVVLCERGIRTFSDHARNTLDISIIPALKKISHLPVVVDPSHAAGHNYMVAPLALASAAAGADGLLIEVHPAADKALCDGAQALSPDQFIELSNDLASIPRRN